MSGSAAAAAGFHCALCGAAFTHGDQGATACSACPLSAGCTLMRCPHCGFQAPPSSRLVEWWRGWRARRTA